MGAMTKKWLYWIVTVGGVGTLPKAPGTWGTLAAIPIWYLFTRGSPNLYLVLTIATIFFAVFASHRYELENESHDSQEIVIDEVAGFLVTMTWLPVNMYYLGAGFILFRLLDALKPWPISYLDKNIKGGYGVVMDDIAAGLIANIALQALMHFA